MPQVLEDQGVHESIRGARSGRAGPAVIASVARGRTLPGPRGIPPGSAATRTGVTVTGVEQLAEARAFTRLRLANWSTSAKAEDVALLVTEMVTNALQHTRGPARLDLVVGEGSARVEVTDGSTESPRVGDVDVESMHGRGLLIVESFAASWGVEKTRSGKTIWAIVDR